MDAWTVKLDQNGIQEWLVNYPGDAKVGEGQDVKELPNGKFVSIGKKLDLITNWDCLIMLIDGNGNL